MDWLFRLVIYQQPRRHISETAWWICVALSRGLINCEAASVRGTCAESMGLVVLELVRTRLRDQSRFNSKSIRNHFVFNVQASPPPHERVSWRTVGCFGLARYSLARAAGIVLSQLWGAFSLLTSTIVPGLIFPRCTKDRLARL